MDPDANLTEIRRLLFKMYGHPADSTERAADVGRLADLIEALDSWISNGGFLPRDWRTKCARVFSDRPAWARAA